MTDLLSRKTWMVCPSCMAEVPAAEDDSEYWKERARDAEEAHAVCLKRGAEYLVTKETHVEARLDERIRCAAIVLGHERGMLPSTMYEFRMLLTEIAKELLRTGR